MSSSISIPWNFSFCFLFDLSFSPFFLSLPSSSSLSSSSSVSLLSLCLDLRYSSHLSGWKSPNHHCYKLQIVIFPNPNHPSSFFDLSIPLCQNNFHNPSSLNKEIHDCDGYLILISIDFYAFIYISNTWDSVWPHFQTLQSVLKDSTARRILNSLLGVWTRGQTQSGNSQCYVQLHVNQLATASTYLECLYKHIHTYLDCVFFTHTLKKRNQIVPKLRSST